MTFEEKLDKARDNVFEKYPEMDTKHKLALEFHVLILKTIGEDEIKKRLAEKN